ncbi:MAG: hypothetical protein ACLP7F_21910 [Acidimicrobiales bacterium]
MGDKPLGKVIAEHIAAVNAFDLDAIVATFAKDAFVNDARREFWASTASGPGPSESWSGTRRPWTCERWWTTTATPSSGPPTTGSTTRRICPREN